MPQLLDRICTIIGAVYEHAKCHGDCSALKRREMKGLIWKEFSEVIQIPPHFSKMALCDYNSCNSALCGINTSCVSQVPPSEVVIQPPPVAVTIPGPILSASYEPVAVAQNNPCATGYGPYSGYGGYGCDSGYGCSYGYGRSYCYGSSYPCSYTGYGQRYSFGNSRPC